MVSTISFARGRIGLAVLSVLRSLVPICSIAIPSSRRPRLNDVSVPLVVRVLQTVVGNLGLASLCPDCGRADDQGHARRIAAVVATELSMPKCPTQAPFCHSGPDRRARIGRSSRNRFKSAASS